MPFKPKTPLPALGDLEIAVLEELWAVGDMAVKDMHRRIGPSRGIALNTVQSAMDRLFRKGFLDRTKQQHAFLYSTRLSREALIGGLINEVVGRFDTSSDFAVSAFVNATESWDDDELQRLESALRERRDEGGAK